MLKTCIRFFKKKTPLFESSHRYTLPRNKNSLGSSLRGEKLNDPDRLQKVKKLVHDYTHVPGMILSESVKKLAKTDTEFNEFLRGFRTKDEPEWSEYLNQSKKKVKAEDYLKSMDDKLKKDKISELHLMDQFRKKKIAESLYEALDYDENQDEYDNEDLDEKIKKDPESSGLRVTPRRREIAEEVYFDLENFTIMFIDAGSCTNVTKLARVSSRKVLLYMGNTDGIISYGKGKGVTYQVAYENAVMALKANLICIDLDHYMTICGTIISSFHDTTVEIRPARLGEAWGNPLHYNIIALAGLANFRFKIRCRNHNYYNLIYCFFECLTKNMTPRQLAERSGQKLYQITYGRGTKKDYDNSFVNIN